MVIDSSWIPILVGVGFGLVLLSAVMLAFCYWYRRKRRIRREIRDDVVNKYRTLLFDWIAGENPTLEPPEQELEWIFLTSLWNDLYQKVGPSEHDRLREAADELDLQSKARKLLESHSTDQQITGVITLGHLGDTERINQIEALTESSAKILKMRSIKALSVLKPKLALKKIYDDLVENPHQSQNYYLGFCRNIDTNIITEVTLERLETVPADARSRIVPFLELADNQQSREYINDQLEQTDRPEILSACLKVLRKIGDPSDQKTVVPYLSHTADFVRIQAARTLGAIGNSEVVDVLIEKLSDSNWWVRYRAAEALVQIPSTSTEELKHILSKLTQTQSRRALEAAITEVEIG